MKNETIPRPQAHLDFCPRARPRYGQAHSPSRSPDRDEIPQTLETIPRTQGNIPYSQANPFPTFFHHGQTNDSQLNLSRELDQSHGNQKLTSHSTQNLSLKKIPISQNFTPSRASPGNAFQQKYFLSAENLYKKPKTVQMRQDMPFLDLSGIKSPAESKFPKYRSFSASEAYANAFSTHKFALSRNTHKHFQL